MVQLAQRGAMIELGGALGAIFDADFSPETADSAAGPTIVQIVFM